MTARVRRQRGEVETLPSGSLRVKVYAGIDPVTKQRHYLTETVPAGPTADREAEKVRTRFLAQVDERRNPSTRATMSQLLDRWLSVLDVEVSTRQGYVKKIEKHIRPLLGSVALAKIDAEALESFYAVLRRCRAHCNGRRFVEHRKAGDHDPLVGLGHQAAYTRPPAGPSRPANRRLRDWGSRKAGRPRPAGA